VRKILKQAPLLEPQFLPLSIDLQARDAFFIYYANGTSKCWNFLKRYYHPTDSPDHLTVAIEAVSLAYLWHHVDSHVALATARKKYISALRMTNKALKSPEQATKDTTLVVSLLLDLFGKNYFAFNSTILGPRNIFREPSGSRYIKHASEASSNLRTEKITDSKPLNNKPWVSHVNGALALVRLRGLEDFHDPVEFHVLIRLINHYTASCIASASLVPDELIAIRDYVANDLYIQDHTLKLSDLMVRYAKLRHDTRSGILSSDECIRESMGLDLELQALDLEMPLSWQYSTTLMYYKSDRALDFHYDSYPHRNICHARNFIRIGRILLNESLIDHYLALPAREKYSPLIDVAYSNIDTLAREICACVPQYADCDGSAQEILPTSEKSKFLDLAPGGILNRGSGRGGHSHTLHHQADCYSLIFPLYAAGRSKAGPDVRPWVIKQLHYIGSHFYIRNAEVVAQILEQETDVCPWDVFSLLGAYAYNA
jgi:hypothetical protein